MKRITKIIGSFLLAICCLTATAQNYTRQGTVFTQKQTAPTVYTYVDSKGTVYPVYITDSGRCYILKVSKKTGKEYKYYLSEDISRTICAGRVYKEKKS